MCVCACGGGGVCGRVGGWGGTVCVRVCVCGGGRGGCVCVCVVVVVVCGATTSCYSNITRVLLSDSIHTVPSRNVVGRGVFDFCTDQFTCDALALALIKLSCECGELGVCGLMHVCMLPTRMICLHARIMLTYARHVLGLYHMCAWLAHLHCT